MKTYLKIQRYSETWRKNTEESYIGNVQTVEGWGGERGGLLKFVTCFQILLILNNSSMNYFWRSLGKGIKKIVIFCGCHKSMTPYREEVFRNLYKILHHQSLIAGLPSDLIFTIIKHDEQILLGPLSLKIKA